jgi:hypothetical protein
MWHRVRGRPSVPGLRRRCRPRGRPRPSRPSPTASGLRCLWTVAAATRRRPGSVGPQGEGQRGASSSTASPDAAPTKGARTPGLLQFPCRGRCASSPCAMSHRGALPLARRDSARTRRYKDSQRRRCCSRPCRHVATRKRGYARADHAAARYPRGMAASSRCVYSSRGVARICSVAACSTTTPSFITSTSSLMKRTTARSWLMKT